MSVVLPEPFGPIRPKRSPGAISMLTSESAVKPPKCFETPWIFSSGFTFCEFF
jgi:hypothetical protein